MTTWIRCFRPLLLTAGLLGAATVSTPAEAATLEACGNIEVAGTAECELLVEGGCTAQCEPFRFEAACAAELQAECAGSCEGSASLDCTATCSAECVADCDIDPGTLDCGVQCQANCEGDCEAACGGDSECFASCEATCGASCDASCSGTPPSASCEAKCEAACDGSCEAQAEIDCQVDCQASGFAECEAELQGRCEAQCQRPEGALFCDGSYVDTANQLEECIQALQEQLNVEVQGSARADCAGGECAADAQGSVSCAVRPSSQQGFLNAMVALMIMMLIPFTRDPCRI